MARSIQTIKKTMTDAFMAHPVIREKYGLADSETFEDVLSVISLESLLFFIVASCCHVLEVLFDKHVDNVNSVVAHAVVASVAWYHDMALKFQYGDALVYDNATYQFRYLRQDSSKQVVKYVAVRDRGTWISILVSGDKDGRPVPLSNEVRTAFEDYMNRVKIAGVILSIKSLPADTIQINADIKIDPLIYRKDGTNISDGKKPVEAAINQYLKGIVYGGTFNKTKLVDAIQSVPGVIDVELKSCLYSSDRGKTYHLINGNNYASVGGSFIAAGLTNTLHYVV